MSPPFAWQLLVSFDDCRSAAPFTVVFRDREQSRTQEEAANESYGEAEEVTESTGVDSAAWHSVTGDGVLWSTVDPCQLCHLRG